MVRNRMKICVCAIQKISTTLFLVATGSWLFYWASLTKMPHLGYNCTWIIGYSDHLQLFQGNLQLQLQSSSGGSRLLLIIMQSQSLPYKFWSANVPSTKISKKKIGNFIVLLYIKLEVRLETIENVESIKWSKSRVSHPRCLLRQTNG